MRWTDEDPGAGDLAAVRQLGDLLDDTLDTLAQVRSSVRGCTDDVPEQVWSGTAADAWRDSAEQCADDLHELLDQVEPLGAALRDYADRVEEIADEAARARQRRADAQLDLDGLALLAPSMSATTSPRLLRGWTSDRADAQHAVRTADQVLADLADDRSAADARVCGEIAATRPVAWAPPIAVPAVGPVGAAAPADEPPDLLEGAFALVRATKDGIRLATKTTALVTFYRAATADVTGRMRAAIRLEARAQDALRRFVQGSKDGGVLGKVIGSRAAGLVGKAFLPVTIASGGIDAWTGGGYDGARGWTTRGLGLAGAVGAGYILAAPLGLFMATPVGLAVAGAAVLAYGAWSLGNLVWDHREAIGAFLSAAGTAVQDGWSAAGGALSGAADWADDAVHAVTDRVADVGRGLLTVLSFGAS
ncbi:MAG TPA: hypothetical protein VGC67_07205 [Cellulomonas sp.]